MADHKKVIVQFHKHASNEDKQKLINELKGKGATITSEDNINSTIATVPENHYDTLRSDSLTGDHPVVKNVEEDGEVRIL